MKTFLMAMTLVAPLTILCIHPVLAQIDSDYPAEIFPDRESTPVVPDLGESWDVGPGPTCKDLHKIFPLAYRSRSCCRRSSG